MIDREEEQKICEMYHNGTPHTKIAKIVKRRHQCVKKVIMRNNVKMKEKICLQCRSKFYPKTMYQKYCSKNCRNKAEHIRYDISSKKRLQKQRKMLIKKLGGKCVNCGVTDWRVLQVNHINGNGKKEITLKGNGRIYREILKGEREGEFDLRCANCNLLYEYEVGRRSDLT